MSSAPVVEDSPKVFVGNLSFNTTKESLSDHFASAGKVVAVNIIHRGRRSLGYGFISFETEEAVQKAVESLNQVEVDGRALNVQAATAKKPKAERGGNARRGRRPSNRSRPSRPKRDHGPESKTSLFVANLPFSATDESLSELFSKFSLKSAHVVTRKNGSSKGYGFVEVADEAAQKRAIEELNDLEIEGRKVSVKAAFEELSHETSDN